jgi:signal transduction histidine kinase
MDQTLPLTDAYQRLLEELSRRLGADHAELLLHIDPQNPAHVVARYGAGDPVEPNSTRLDVPISEGALEVGRLQMVFAPGSSLPGPAERSMAQALVELAALLVEEHHKLTWGPLRQAGRRILAVTEEELQRIILDIHDGPIQKLFAVSSQLALLQDQLAESTDDTQQALMPSIERLNRLVQSALQEIRTALSTFRPAEFQRRALPEVVEGLAFQHESLTGNQVDLYIEEDIPPVSLPVKIAIYRVLQEALSNAYRHAGVDRHEVHLSSQSGWVMVEVIDYGRGFTPPPLEGPTATEREEHIGLRGMRERMHLVGGQLRVFSRPGKGTRVVVMVPGNA